MLTAYLQLASSMALVGANVAVAKILAGAMPIALIAGLLLFGIRLTSDSAWWTGHLSYSLH